MKRLIIIGFLTFFASCNKGSSRAQQPPIPVDTKYLVFQLFTYNPGSGGYTQPFDTGSIRNQIDEILTAVDNNVGDGNTRQLGFSVGPLSFDHTDDMLRTIIRESFIIAEEKNVALVLHLDESMFWINRQNLWGDSNNATGKEPCCHIVTLAGRQ